jgi:hypothetical protein
MKLPEIINYLEKYKSLVGLDQYKILVNKKFESSDALATVEGDIFEKILKFTISKDFKKKDTSIQKSILIHELIHGRLAILEKEKEQLTTYLEESYCNDLERGIFKLIKESEM